MLPTLQWYIFREMGKTFLLAAIGLTAVLGLGGGVMNLIELEQVTPSQLLRLMFIVLPVAASLTLPVAALYAATATFGRLSADNEFVACRSSGINIHRLFFPPVVLSVLVAACTLQFTCFLIPGMVRDLEDLARQDIRQFVVQRLDSPKRLSFPGIPVRLYADRTAQSVEDPSAVVLQGVAFIRLLEDKFVQYGTAESIVIQFSQTPEGETALSGRFVEATMFDERQGGWGKAGDQAFGPQVLAQQIGMKVKWLDLAELLRYGRRPQEWPKVADAIRKVRAAMVRDRFSAATVERFNKDSKLVLSQDAAQITIQAATAAINPENDDIEFENITVTERRGGTRRTLTADKATLSCDFASDPKTRQAVLTLKSNVEVSAPNGTKERKSRERLADIGMDNTLIGDADEIDSVKLIDPQVDSGMGQSVRNARLVAAHEAQKIVRRVVSELHSRLCFSAGVLVLVVLGASLGMMFRGSHAITAFAISFVPAIFVIVMNIMGRQLAEKDGTVELGLAVLWGSIGVVGVLDVWAMARWVRR